MDRPTLLPIGIAVLIFVGAALLWSVSSSPERAPREHVVEGLAGPATIHWQPSGVASASIQDQRDAAFTLGYIHGMQRTWTLLLWRQAATGHLSTWFGEAVMPIDEHVHQLGIPHGAREALSALPDTTRRELDRYTEGINAALSTQAAANRKPLLALGIEAKPWSAWHSLAVERLFAWLAADPLPAYTPETAGIARFRERDALLHRFLHVHGLDRSVAWSRRDSGAVITSRLVTGATARPLLQDVVIDTDDGTRWTGGTLPGAPIALSGTRRTGNAAGTAWSLLPGHRPSLQRVAADSLPRDMRYARLTPHAADEHLVHIPRVPLPGGRAGLPLDAPRSAGDTISTVAGPVLRSSLVRSLTVDAAPNESIPPDSISPSSISPDSVAVDSVAVDSTWVLSWSGLAATSDLSAWAALAHGDASGFALHDASGLLVNESGTVSVFGTPPHRAEQETPDGALLVIGRSPWVHPVGQSLASQRERRAATESLSDTSAWAGLVLERTLPHLDDLHAPTPRMREARTYLRNWDANYERASIGASVFEVWMDEYARDAGAIPFLQPTTAADTLRSTDVRKGSLRSGPRRPARAAPIRLDRLPPDRTFFAAHRQRQAFRRAVKRLTAAHGTDLRQWRWERVAPDRRSFPVWSADSLIQQDLSALASTRYAPIEVPGIGHPSTPSGGPSLLAPTTPARSPAAWTAWTAPQRDHLVVRRHAFDVDAFFSRPFLRRDVAPALAVVPPGDPEAAPSPDAARPGMAPEATGGDENEMRETRLLPASR